MPLSHKEKMLAYRTFLQANPRVYKGLEEEKRPEEFDRLMKIGEVYGWTCGKFVDILRSLDFAEKKATERLLAETGGKGLAFAEVRPRISYVSLDMIGQNPVISNPVFYPIGDTLLLTVDSDAGTADHVIANADFLAAVAVGKRLFRGVGQIYEDGQIFQMLSGVVEHEALSGLNAITDPLLTQIVDDDRELVIDQLQGVVARKLAMQLLGDDEGTFSFRYRKAEEALYRKENETFGHLVRRDKGQAVTAAICLAATSAVLGFIDSEYAGRIGTDAKEFLGSPHYRNIFEPLRQEFSTLWKAVSIGTQSRKNRLKRIRVRANEN